MKKILFLLFFVFWAIGVQSQQVLEFTLEDCIQYAETHNLTLKTAQLNRESSEITYRQSKNAIAPTVSASASQGYGYSHHPTNGGSSWNGSYGLNVNMSLFKGLSKYHAIQQSKLNLTYADLQIENEKDYVKIEIIQAFLTVLMNQELLAYQEEVAKTSEEQLKQGEIQYQVGKIMESDYLLLKAQYASDQYTIENTKITIANNILTLKNLLALSHDYTLSVIKPANAEASPVPQMPEMKEVLEQTLNYLPRLKMADAQLAAAEYDVKLAKSDYYPSLSLQAGVSTSYLNFSNPYGTQLGENLGENVGIQLNIPIFNQYATRSRVSQAKIALQQTEIQKLQQELDVVRELEQEYLKTKQYLNSYQVLEIQEKAYHASYMAYNEKFKAGVITTVELLQQQTNYLNVLNEFLQTKYAFLLNRKVLDIYMGVPVKL